MKYIPELEEERFQSMVAVPILARAGDTIGVIVLHTKAPHEFTEDTLKLLVHIASLVSGAIENAQLYDQQRRRVDSLTRLSGLAREVSAATNAADLGQVVAAGTRVLLGAAVCQLYRVESATAALAPVARDPATELPGPAMSATGLLLAAVDGGGERPPARTLWPELDVADLLVAPLTAGGERVGLLCAGAPAGRPFTDEDTELARAIAHLTAIAFKRAELIEGLTNANIVKDLFEALAAGATTFAAAKAAEVRCDLGGPYLMVYAEPAAAHEQGSGEWRAAAEVLGRELASLTPDSAVDAGPGSGARGPGHAPPQTQRIERADARVPCARRGRQRPIGISELHEVPPTPRAHIARRSTRPRSNARCWGREGQSPTHRSAPTATWSTSLPRTHPMTGCGRRSTG